MFTGLVEALGIVAHVRTEGAGRWLTIREPGLAPELVVGESVAVNGVCLTVVEQDATTFRFQAGPETLSRTNLGELQPGDRVNLERSLRLSDRLGGHLVQGHVDGLGRIASRQPQQDWDLVWFDCPHDLTRYLVSKGSIAVDGVSLTLVEVSPQGFSVALIPHTLKVTTLGFKKVGDAVNLEIDMLAKYVWNYVSLLHIS